MALAIQRSVLMQNLAQCDFSFDEELDISSSPTRMCISDPVNGYLRGSVVGNWLVWVAFAAAPYAARFATARATGKPLLACTDAVWLPGILIVPFAFLLQPTVSASTALLFHVSEEESAADVVIGIGSLVLIISIIAGMGFVFSSRRFGSVKVPVDENEEIVHQGWKRTLLRAVVWCFADKDEWTDVERHSGFTQRFGKIFEPCRSGMHGFVVFELINSGICGVLGGVMPSTASGCIGVLISLLTVCAVYLLALVVCRPYATRIDQLTSLFSGLCNLIIAILAVSGQTGEGATTSFVLVYGSLVSVLAFLCHVIILTRLHKRIPSLFQVVLAAWSSDSFWVGGNKCKSDQKIEPLGVLVTPPRENYQQKNSHFARSEEAQAQLIDQGANKGQKPGGSFIEGGLTADTRRRMELLACLSATVSQALVDQQQPDYIRQGRSQKEVVAALAVLVECACSSVEIFHTL